MTVLEFLNILIVAIALAMDSFTVSISGGASLKKVTLKDVLWVAGYFGFFQFFMTILGWQGGLLFNDLVSRYAPWIAAGLLLVIGGKMIYESFEKMEDESFSFSHKMLFTLAVATSIDALGVGLGYSLLNKPVFTYSIIIGITAFIFSALGVYLGKFLKQLLSNKAELLGGLILVGIAVNMALKNGAP